MTQRLVPFCLQLPAKKICALKLQEITEVWEEGHREDFSLRSLLLIKVLGLTEEKKIPNEPSAIFLVTIWKK